MNDNSKNNLGCTDPLMSAMLADYFMGNLPTSDAERFEDHFVSCDKCQADYEELAELLLTARDCRTEVLAELAAIRAREAAHAPHITARPKVTKSAWTILKEQLDNFFSVRFLIPVVAVAAVGVFFLRLNDPSTEPNSPPIVDKTVEKSWTDTSAVVPEVEPNQPEVKTKNSKLKQATITETKKDTTGPVTVNPAVPTPSRTERMLPGTVPSGLFDNTPLALRTERPTNSPPNQGGTVTAPINPVETEAPPLATSAGTPGIELPATGIPTTSDIPVLIVPDITVADQASRKNISNEFLTELSNGLRQRLQLTTGYTVSKTPQVPALGGNGKMTSRILVRTAIRAVEGKQDEVMLEIVMTNAVTGKLLSSNSVRGRAEDLPALVANSFKVK